MDEITWGDIYKEFCEWSPEHAKMVKKLQTLGQQFNCCLVEWWSCL